MLRRQQKITYRKCLWRMRFVQPQLTFLFDKIPYHCSRPSTYHRRHRHLRHPWSHSDASWRHRLTSFPVLRSVVKATTLVSVTAKVAWGKTQEHGKLFSPASVVSFVSWCLRVRDDAKIKWIDVMTTNDKRTRGDGPETFGLSESILVYLLLFSSYSSGSKSVSVRPSDPGRMSNSSPGRHNNSIQCHINLHPMAHSYCRIVNEVSLICWVSGNSFQSYSTGSLRYVEMITARSTSS